MDELRALRSLAAAMGVHTRYTDGLGRPVRVGPETLVRVCAALGAPVAKPADAAEAIRVRRASGKTVHLPPVVVAWDGVLPELPHPRGARVELRLEDGAIGPAPGRPLHEFVLPFGYHRLTMEIAGHEEAATVIAAPVQGWRRDGERRSWGVGTQLAALRSSRSRALGDLRDLESLCRWVMGHGGDLVTVLPLYPTFNTEPAEPSPYSPVSRLFWSELIADLEHDHQPVPIPDRLDVTRASEEVWRALANRPVPEDALQDAELVRYALFRGAQAKLGRDWRAWPTAARAGTLEPEHVDAMHERFHLVAQVLVRRQLHDLRERLDRDGFRLGLDLAVGVHPDSYDTWSRQALFCDGMSVGAPPDFGFPSGQDWGFAPVLPDASRREGHRYIAASVAHQARLAGVLRVDHIMAWTRLYWIPHGLGLHEGTYVTYPAEELFAILTLESVRHRCEVVGENLGTVPKEIFEALPRHRIWGMYLAQFEAANAEKAEPPAAANIALVGSHDTPTFAGWIMGADIGDRVKYQLLDEARVADVTTERGEQVAGLAKRIRSDIQDPRRYFGDVLDWLGRSESPLVIPWLEDFWLEDVAVNLPGTPSFVRPNWQRPMRKLLDEIFTDAEIDVLIRRLERARKG